jgi:uncharacterized membrane protein YfcA
MEILIPVAIIALGGLIKGLSGFGYALISTSLLTMFMPAQEAIALMIIPLIAGNLELAVRTDKKELENCLRNFSDFLVFLAAGVTAGMLVITAIPSQPLKKSVGLIALTFAASKTSFFENHFERVREFCFRRWEPLVGFFSGTVYGATNVGVLVVAYLESRDLDREKFVGTLAVAILGISVYRIFLAQATGLYSGTDRIVLSLGLAVPAVAAVWTGGKLEEKASPETLEWLSVLLIAVIGAKLLLPF